MRYQCASRIFVSYCQCIKLFNERFHLRSQSLELPVYFLTLVRISVGCHRPRMFKGRSNLNFKQKLSQSRIYERVSILW